MYGFSLEQILKYIKLTINSVQLLQYRHRRTNSVIYCQSIVTVTIVILFLTCRENENCNDNPPVYMLTAVYRCIPGVPGTAADSSNGRLSVGRSSHRAGRWGLRAVGRRDNGNDREARTVFGSISHLPANAHAHTLCIQVYVAEQDVTVNPFY